MTRQRLGMRSFAVIVGQPWAQGGKSQKTADDMKKTKSSVDLVAETTDARYLNPPISLAHHFATTCGCSKVAPDPNRSDRRFGKGSNATPRQHTGVLTAAAETTPVEDSLSKWYRGNLYGV